MHLENHNRWKKAQYFPCLKTVSTEIIMNTVFTSTRKVFIPDEGIKCIIPQHSKLLPVALGEAEAFGCGLGNSKVCTFMPYRLANEIRGCIDYKTTTAMYFEVVERTEMARLSFHPPSGVNHFAKPCGSLSPPLRAKLMHCQDEHLR